MASHDGSAPRASGTIQAAHRQRRIGWTLTLILVAVYLAYLLSVVLAPEAMAVPIGGNLTPGLLFGVCVILIALVLASYYVSQANRNDARNARRS